MVCSIGGGRMATMARLLEAGSVSQAVTAPFTHLAEEVGRWTLTAQYIHRELIEADEANLLNEEDMQIFGLKPMTDPLNLVCCNSCKKPVKASQYKDHADLCKALSCTNEITPELDGGMVHKKPPRKERKRSLTAYATPVGEIERLGAADAQSIGASEHHPGNSPRVDGAIVTDGSVVNSGNPDFSASVMQPPPKRFKSIAAVSPLISDDIETAGGITKSFCISTQEALTYRGFLHDSRVGFQKTRNNQIPSDIYSHYRYKTEGTPVIPAPLATKIFYSQRNSRLRLALSQLYYQSCTNQHGQDFDDMKLVQGHMVSLTPISENIHHQQKQSNKHLLSSTQDADQIPAQSSEVNYDRSGACPTTMNFSSQYPVNNALGPHRTPVETIESNYLSNTYSLAANSGNPVGRVQQPKGSVPVV